MKKSRMFFLLVTMLLTLAACKAMETVDLPGETDTGSAETPVETDSGTVAGANCPEAESGTHQLVHTAQGYCFLYPDNYDVFQGDDGSVALYVRSLLNTEAPFASVQREAVDGRALEDIAAEHLAAFGLPESEVQEVTIGGEPAILLDNLPGQDTNRRVLTVHDDFVYDLLVARIGEDYGPVGEQAEALFDLISASWQFTAIEPEAPLLAGPECPEATGDTMLFSNAEDGYCLLLPNGYMVDDGLTTESGGGETAVYMNSLQDVEHARLFVTVEDAQGRTLEEVTTAREEEIESALPGSDALWSFGYMLDGVPANQFDQAPGQDLSRQLLLVHDGRFYTLTFIPDDPQAGAAYSEMETLYETVLDSFSFLWPSS